MTTPFPIEDTVGAWVPHGKFVLPPSADGPLAGLKFAVKDVYDVAGHPTGAGNPQWLATHAIPQQHAPLVAQLLGAGASLYGKTVTDELAYSIHGDNLHYGMPLNSAAPDRIPGGSSSGSVAAVAAGLVDFALGTDTGGSTRVPASYCGVWGLRTTHGLLSRQGLVPLHPGFDTATWFAHSPSTFVRVGAVLLPVKPFTPRRVLWLGDAIELAEPAFLPAMQRVYDALVQTLGGGAKVDITAGDSLENWRQAYVTVGAFEGWQAHGAWIQQHTPVFAPAIAERWKYAAGVSAAQAEQARQKQAAVRAHVHSLLGEDSIAVLPSAASVAPLRNASGPEIDDIRMRTLRIGCIAGLAGLPQVSIPMRAPNGLPVGVSLLGPMGSDLALIRIATRLHSALTP
jgi:amidase